jgi:cytochrome b
MTRHVRPQEVRTFAAENPAPQAGEVMVWDRAVRLFHWLLATAVFAALATGFVAPRPWLDAHVVLGTAAAVLVLFRLVWGVLGPTYARFASFPPDPRAALAHAGAMLRGRTIHDAVSGRSLRDPGNELAENPGPEGGFSASGMRISGLISRNPHFLGHNPLGAMMVATLLVVIAALTVTGVVMLGGLAKEGPLAATTSFAAGATARDIHAALGWLILALAVLHITGVLIESRREGQSLVWGMVTGRKAAVPGAVTAPERAARPRLAAAILATLTVVLVPAIVMASRQPAAGVPTAPLDPLYVRECGSCHSPHHPSIAPAATWAGIVEHLATHFEEDASLSEADTARLSAYLADNSAERFDTKAANLLRTPSADAPLRITATAGWTRLHRDVPANAFTTRAVGGRLNCSACHADAETGRFAARAIALPKETH